VKRSTLILLVAAAVLAAVTFYVTRDRSAGPPAGLSIAGYASEEDLAKEKARGLLEGPLDIDHPVDEVVLDRAEGTVRLVREGSGKEASWKLSAPVDAVAVKYLVEKIIGAFKTPTESVFATQVKEADLPLYDLEPERRVGLTLKSKGAVWNGVELWIGRTEVADDAAAVRGGEPEVDTWVMVKSAPGTVYRLGGKDLRAPVSEPLETLRDKKVFTTPLEDLREIAVTAPDGRRVALSGTLEEAPPAPAPAEGEAPAPAPKPTVTWAMTAPAGVKGDASASALARNFVNLRAKAFVPADKAPTTALGGAIWKIEAKTADGKELALTVQDGGKDDVWARVEGREERMTLNGYGADGLRKTLEDLQDKTVLDLPAEQVTGITLSSLEGPLHLVRAAAGAPWTFETPAVPYPADAASLVASVAKVSALRWARPDEVEAARAALAAAEAFRGGVTTAAGASVLTFSAKLTGDELEGKRWGALGDPASAAPFLVNDYVATRFESTVDKLRSKKLMGERTQADLRSLTVTNPGGDVVALDAPGGGELALTGLPAGKTADEAAVRGMAATAATLVAKSFVTGKDAAELGLTEAGVTQVAVGFADGATLTVRISAKTDGTDPYATVDGGPLAGSFFTLNTYQVKNLQKRGDEIAH